MNDLDRRLAQGPLAVRAVWTAETPERVARRILRQRRLKLAVTASAGACALALAPLLWTKHASAPLELAVSSPAMSSPEKVKAVAAPEPTRLQGSTAGAFAGDALAELSGDEARLIVEDDSPEHVVARLSGKGRFRVLRRPGRSVEIRTAELRMRVLGSSFMVEELPAGRAHVEVERGQVEITWGGGTALLEGGQSGTFPPLAEAAPTPKLARSVRPDPAGKLMEAADAARLGGKPERAVAPLKRLYERHPRDRRAPLAAFSLGRVLLDDLHRPAQAAAAFKKARTLWPAGPLVHDALAREAEARAAAGQRAQAAELAAQYLAREPGGSYAAAMRALSAR
jgi:hypothetical protein